MNLDDGDGVYSCAKAGEGTIACSRQQGGSERQNGVQPKRTENGKEFAAHSGSSRPTQGGSDGGSNPSEDEDPWEDKMAKAWRKLQQNLKNPSVAGGQPPPRLRKGPSVREARGTRYYLRKEVDELSELIGKLETAVMNAHSFREPSSSLLEEAHRARGRLELAIQAQQHQELIVVASEIKACVRRGLTLVHVYGEFSMTWKVVTQLFRSAAYEKFGKAISDLQSLLPPVKPIALAPTSSGGTATLLELCDTTNVMSRTPPHSGTLPPVLSPTLDHASTFPSPGPAHTSSTTAANLQARTLGRSSNSLSTTQSLTPPQAAQSNTTRAAAAKVVPPPQARTLGRSSNSLSTTQSLTPPQAAQSNTTRAAAAKVVPPPQGKVLKEGKHDRVLSAAFVPLQASSNNYPPICLWWSTTTMLEFWTEAGGSTTGFRTGKDSQVVTAIGIDSDGNVWTGHQKGLVRVRQKMQWDLVLSDKAFSQPIKCIAFDEHQGNAWVGDEGGHVKVMRCSYPDPDAASEDEARGKLRQTTGPSLRGASRGSPQKSNAPAAAGEAADGDEVAHTQLDVIATLQPTLMDKITVGFLNQCFGCGRVQAAKQAVCDKPPDRPTEGPIRCIHLQDSRAWISGGISNSQPWLSVFDSTTFQHIDTWECGEFGTATVMDSMSWHLPSLPPRTSTENQTPRQSHGESTAPAGHQWRLLTGHENGQLLLWNPHANRLSPLIMIGPPGSPIRGIKVMEEEQLVCSAHYSGDMVIFAVPPLDVIVPPIALASKAVDSFGVFKPKTAVHKLHKGALLGMVNTGGLCATWSMQGSIKLWTVHDFVDIMARQGLVRSLSHQNSSGSERFRSQGTSGSALERACNGATADMQEHGQSGTESAQTSSRERSLQMQNRSNISQTASQEVLSGTRPGATQPGQKADGSGTSGRQTPVPDFGGAVQLIDSSEIKLQKQIGSGAYGKVYLAEWLGCQVAVKELTGLAGDFRDTKAWQEMQHEVHMLGTYNHPNIMRFMAVCLDPPMIVMQYYSHGSLFDLLSKAQRQNVRAMRELAWQKRLGMLKDVAAGMHYLHTRRPPVVHGDLRSPNLLLDLTIDSERPRFHVKIADFGLARMLGQSQSIAISKTTNPRWTAPEVIRDFVLGPSGDVYSFAIIMWEMLTWKQPYEDMMSAQVIFSTVTADYRPSVEEGDVAGNPGVTLPQFQELMEQCWSPDANKRPTFKRVVEVLQEMLEIESQAARDAAASQKGSQQKGGNQQGADGTGAPKSAGAHKPPSSKSPGSSKGLTAKTGDGQQQQQHQRPLQDSASSHPPSEVAIMLTNSPQAADAQGHHTLPLLSPPESHTQPTLPPPLPPPHPSHHTPSHSRSKSLQNLPFQHQHSGPQPLHSNSPQHDPHSHPHHNQHRPLPHSHNRRRKSTDEQQQMAHDDSPFPRAHSPAHGRRGRGRGHLNEGRRGHSNSPPAESESSAGAGGAWGGGKEGAPNRAGSNSTGDGREGGINQPAFVPHATATQRQAFNPSRLARAGSAADSLPTLHSTSHATNDELPGSQRQESFSRTVAEPLSEENLPLQVPLRSNSASRLGENAQDGAASCAPKSRRHSLLVVASGSDGDMFTSWRMPPSSPESSTSSPSNELHQSSRRRRNRRRGSTHKGVSEHAAPGPSGVRSRGSQGPQHQAYSAQQHQTYSAQQHQAHHTGENHSRAGHRRQGSKSRRASVELYGSHRGGSGEQGELPVGVGQGASRGHSSCASHTEQQHQQQQLQPQSSASPVSASSQTPPPPQHRRQTEARPYAPLASSSPFSVQLAEEAKPYAPLASSSPFSMQPVEEAKPFAPLASSSPFSAQPAADAKPYAPLASSSPFSSQPAEDAKPYAPLASSSPFSSQPAGEAKPYAPLASSSPFSAQPAEDPKPYAPLASSSPFSAQPAEDPKPYAPLASSSPFSVQLADDAKPYAPLAFSSPFSAQPAGDAKPYAPLASSSPFSPQPAGDAKPYAPLASSSPFSGQPAEEAKPYAPLASSSPFASLPPFD